MQRVIGELKVELGKYESLIKEKRDEFILVNTNRNKPYSNSKKFNSFSKFKENFEDNFNIGTPSKSNSRNNNERQL